jgi:DNA primase
LYNYHQIAKPADDIIVVEGFASVWWLHQWGYRQVVSLMGSDCSDEQAKLIANATAPNCRVWIFTDADRAGDLCAASVLTKVAPYRWTRWVKLAAGQPTDCTPGDLEQLLPDPQTAKVSDVNKLI